MNNFEQLCQEAADNDVEVISHRFNSDRIKGLYCDGTAALNTSLKTSAQKACILAEELGHHFTSVGNILNLENQNNSKQEQIARAWAYKRMIGLESLIRCFERNCLTIYEMAEYLDVTEDFLKDSLDYYRRKYSEGVVYNNYFIRFVPTLAIARL